MKLLHRHKWSPTEHALLQGTRWCKCGAFQTEVFDWSLDTRVWRNGLLTTGSGQILIFAGNKLEFEAAQRLLITSVSVKRERITFATARNLTPDERVDVYFYGTWWENPAYQTEYATEKINLLLHPA